MIRFTLSLAMMYAQEVSSENSTQLNMLWLKQATIEFNNFSVLILCI